MRKYKQYDDDPGRNGTVPSKQVVSERGKLSSSARDSRLGAEKNENQVQQGLPTRNAYVTDVYVEKFDWIQRLRADSLCRADMHSQTGAINQTEPAEPIDEEAALEARRKRREAIRAKYRSQATPLHLQALQLADADTDISTPGTDTGSVHETTGMSCLDSPSKSTQTNVFAILCADSPLISPANTPKAQPDDVFPDFKIGNDSDLAKSNIHVDGLEKDEPSAADYDPTMDMKEDRSKHGHGSVTGEVSSAAYDETKTSKQDVLMPDAAPKIPADAPKKDPYDMFADDDDDDMFAEEKEEPTHASAKSAIPQAKELDISMMDNWDDPEGYYNVRLGELINGRYHIQQNLGKGMFSSVVRATDSTTGGLVAIKIIRQNDTMRKAGMKEIGILEQLREEDPEDKKHLIRFERFFDHKGHLCMVFENLSMNLREVLKKFGRDVGLNLRAIRTYAQQMFTGLALLRRCNILHADLKPDNLLVNDTRNILKVCDLGSASPASDNEITPYLVSRFYRAPEIILGIQYDYAIDVWSIGCTLFELYTGKILFTGRNNNQMLKSIMECRGKYPPKLLRRGSLAHLHFDDMLNFHSTEQDKVTGRLVTRIVDFKKPTRDLKTRLLGQGTRGLPDIEVKELNLFIDFLERCLSLNPEKRCTPAEALKHPFLARK